jgi:cell division protein FtsB
MNIKNILILLIGLLVILSAARSVSNLASSRGRVSLAEERLKNAQAEQEKLKRELAEVQSDYFREKQARDKLGLAREGDTVIVLPEEDLLRRLSPRTIEEEDLDLPKPNWVKWAKLFLD